MNKKKLRSILIRHKMYLRGDAQGKRADLRGADLSWADLSWADLSGADLSGANLRWANLRWANLRWANLRGTDLRGTDLRGTDLRGADLRRTDLRGTDLSGANLDFSSGIPFHCGGTGIKGDSRLFSQMVYHLTRQDWRALPEDQKTWLNSIPKSILNSFCEYRNDVEEM